MLEASCETSSSSSVCGACVVVRPLVRELNAGLGLNDGLEAVTELLVVCSSSSLAAAIAAAVAVVRVRVRDVPNLLRPPMLG